MGEGPGRRLAPHRGGVEVGHFPKRGPELILKYSGAEPMEDKNGVCSAEMAYQPWDLIEFASGSAG